MNGIPDGQPSLFVHIVNRLIGIELGKLGQDKQRSLRWIYGLFDGQTCRYIGVTSQPAIRRSAHFKKKLTFRIIRQSNKVNALRHEWQIIRAFHRKGQCDLNKPTRHKPPRRMFSDILW